MDVDVGLVREVPGVSSSEAAVSIPRSAKPGPVGFGEMSRHANVEMLIDER